MEQDRCAGGGRTAQIPQQRPRGPAHAGHSLGTATGAHAGERARMEKGARGGPHKHAPGPEQHTNPYEADTCHKPPGGSAGERGAPKATAETRGRRGALEKKGATDTQCAHRARTRKSSPVPHARTPHKQKNYIPRPIWHTAVCNHNLTHAGQLAQPTKAGTRPKHAGLPPPSPHAGAKCGLPRAENTGPDGSSR